ncbi:toll-like receptor 4 [Mytilus californianus]|uniref:toll-like receptor 4 n=1 Tax=Mytilus californianus TaxID=6549 RepID=UPI002245AE7E|nr:toll-like receptor 4 [Mytilus californianus]
MNTMDIARMTCCSILLLIIKVDPVYLCPEKCSCAYRDNRTYRVDCSYEGLTHVPTDIRSYKGLRVILMNNNNISALENGQFNGLHVLNYLDLSHNHLEELSSEMFIGMLNLKTLKLNFNRMYMGQIYENAFRFLENVQVFEMYGIYNDVYFEDASYPVSVLYLKKLTTLKLDGQNNGSFDEEFTQLKNLRNLSLSGINGYCTINRIRENHFVNCPYLIKLNLSLCKINSIDAGAFSNLEKLEDLNLSFNRHLEMTGVKNATVNLKKTNIKTLSLENIHRNYQLIINKDAFTELKNTNLEKLYLDKNDIARIEKDVIYTLPNTMKFLSVRDNKFSNGKFIKELNQLENLETFDCSFQLQSYLSLGEGSPLISLFLQNIVSEKKDEPLKLPPKLRHIYASHMKLNYPVIPSLSFYNNCLETLDLSTNGFETFGGEWKGLHSLKLLNLSSNKLSFIHPDSFIDMKNVSVLLLNDNNIGKTIAKDTLFKIFSSQVNLQYLDLSHNEIKELPKFIFSNLGSLEQLILKDNVLTALDFHLQGLYKIKFIDFQTNSIFEFSDIQRNMLSKLFRTNNLTINLENNKIKCDCQNPNLLKWFNENYIHFVNFHNYKCKFENGSYVFLSRASKLFSQLSNSCKSLQYTLYSLIGSVLFTLFLSMIAIIYYNKRKVKHLISFFSRHVQPYDVLEHDGDSVDNIVYLSYSDRSSQVVSRVEEHLEKNDISCFGKHKVEFGEPEVPGLTAGLRQSDCIVCFLTPDYLQDGFCVQEFRYGIHKGYETGRQIIILVLLEDIDDKNLLIQNEEFYRYVFKNTPYIPRSGEDLLSYIEKQVRLIQRL